ncbi:MAG: hypothetical protein ACREKE_01275 [bacterium]
MAIDINQEVKVWGGFSPQEFWFGSGILILLAALAVVLGLRIKPLLGGIFFFFAGGSFTGFMVYRRGLPKGLLLRRFMQDGSFLFLKIPGIRGADLYHAAGRNRARRFTEALGESHEGR